MIAYDESVELLERARPILNMGPSWAVIDFLEDIIWNGFGGSDEVRHFQTCRLRELLTLYNV